MITKSWTDQEKLETLVTKIREDKIVEGIVRSTSVMNLPVVRENGEKEYVEEETLIVQLPDGITGYCPASEFRERKFKSLAKFVGTKQKFVVTEINLEHQLALLSEKQASAILRERFLEELEQLEKENKLSEKTYDAVVSGYNVEKGIVYVRLNGIDAYMYRSEWSWSGRDIVDAQEGETIKVKVEMFDKEQQLVRVSRRKALPDPYDFIANLKRGQILAAKVSGVHPIHGIFVEVENGVELKAGKVNHLEEPEVGDIVTCVVRSVNPEERKGKVIIIRYPHGKRKKKDLGAFLFE